MKDKETLLEIPRNKLNFVSKEAEMLFDLTMEVDWLRQENQQLRATNISLNDLVNSCQEKIRELKERIKQLDDGFMACVEEKCEIAEEYDKALQILSDYYPPCEKDNFMDENTEYCSINCGVDEEVFKECWRRYIKQELEKGISNE